MCGMFRAVLAIATLTSTPLLALGCGTTTSVMDAPAFDAGCADASVVRDGGGVIDSPEAGAPECPSGPCNYQAQTGCASGQACRPQFDAVSPTVNPGCEAAGSGKAGAACGIGSDCAVGYFCVDAVCRKQCCHGDWSACDPGESCIRQLQVKAGGTVIDSGMDLCFPVNNCDPLSATSCPGAPAEQCVVADPTGAVACETAGTAQLGDACGAEARCAAGLYCAANICIALCRAETCGAGPACPLGQGICTHYARDPVGVGECTPE